MKQRFRTLAVLAASLGACFLSAGFASIGDPSDLQDYFFGGPT
jgi:hypothetical protein